MEIYVSEPSPVGRNGGFGKPAVFLIRVDKVAAIAPFFMELVHLLAGRCETTSWDEAGVWRTCSLEADGMGDFNLWA